MRGVIAYLLVSCGSCGWHILTKTAAGNGNSNRKRTVDTMTILGTSPKHNRPLSQEGPIILLRQALTKFRIVVSREFEPDCGSGKMNEGAGMDGYRDGWTMGTARKF
jgi:hypothetical protein